MLQYRDFVPKQIEAPGFLTPGVHESFEAAVAACNEWLANEEIQLISLETVVLPNIWSRWEEGSVDASIGTSGDAPSRWHQFLRCWYRD
jgi:hypothetical protein